MRHYLLNSVLSFLSSLSVVLFYLGYITPALAEPEESPDYLTQLTSVSQLSDVQPTDWAFQALRSLVERYGCLSGYSDGRFQGDRPLTRYEFAAGLNSCIDYFTQQILVPVPNQFASQEDFATLQRLQTEFATELADLQTRIEVLEAQTSVLEAQQFSTTTQLRGQVLFVVNGGGFTGDEIISPSNALIAESDPTATFIYRIALDLNTSFTGTDILKVRLGSGNGGAIDNTAAVLEPNFGSGLDFSSKPPTNGNLEVTRLYYTFQPLPDLTVSIGPNLRITDYVDLNRYANLSFRDFSTEALVNTYILFPISGPASGAFIDWHPDGSTLTVRAIYIAADAANPTNQGILRGTAPFVRLLYPTNGHSAIADLGDRGLFGDTYQGLVEVEYAPSNQFALRFQYGGGTVFTHRFDVLGVNAEYELTQTIGIFGRYGYSSYTDTAFGDLNPNSWMAGIAIQDLFREGSLTGLAIGQPFIANEIGDATQTNFELFYNLPINNFIRITPVLQVVTDSSNQSDNGAIITGTIRTVLLF